MEMKQDLYFIDENRKRRHKVKVEKMGNVCSLYLHL